MAGATSITLHKASAAWDDLVLDASVSLTTVVITQSFLTSLTLLNGRVAANSEFIQIDGNNQVVTFGTGLESVVSVSGQFILNANTGLTALSMPLLESIGGQVTVTTNAGLDTIYMPLFTSVTGDIVFATPFNQLTLAVNEPFVVTGQFRIASGLSTLDGFVPNGVQGSSFDICLRRARMATLPFRRRASALSCAWATTGSSSRRRRCRSTIVRKPLNLQRCVIPLRPMVDTSKPKAARQPVKRNIGDIKNKMKRSAMLHKQRMEDRKVRREERRRKKREAEALGADVRTRPCAPPRQQMSPGALPPAARQCAPRGARRGERVAAISGHLELTACARRRPLRTSPPRRRRPRPSQKRRRTRARRTRRWLPPTTRKWPRT